MRGVRVVVVAVVGVLVLTLAGCAGSDGSGSSGGPSAGLVALATRRAAVVAAFPGVDPADPSGVLRLARDGFRGVGAVEVRADGAGAVGVVPSVVVATSGGVFARSVVAGERVESLVVGGSGWVRAGRGFWVGRGMSGGAAGGAAGRWVRTDAVVSRGMSLAGVRGVLLSRFAVEWGGGVGDVVLARWRGVSVLRVVTGSGFVLVGRVGGRLLPLVSVFGSGGDRVRLVFSYVGVGPVRVPVSGVGLGAVVFGGL